MKAFVLEKYSSPLSEVSLPTLATAAPTMGVGTIVGIIVSVLGFLITLAGVFTLPDPRAEGELAAQEIRDDIRALALGGTWGSPTSNSDWDWK